MRRKTLAATVAITALGFGGVAPSTGIAKSKAKTKSVKVAAAKAGPLTELCTALRLKPLLDGLTIDLTPIVVVRISKFCD